MKSATDWGDGLIILAAVQQVVHDPGQVFTAAKNVQVLSLCTKLKCH